MKKHLLGLIILSATTFSAHSNDTTELQLKAILQDLGEDIQIKEPKLKSTTTINSAIIESKKENISITQVDSAAPIKPIVEITHINNEDKNNAEIIPSEIKLSTTAKLKLDKEKLTTLNISEELKILEKNVDYSPQTNIDEKIKTNDNVYLLNIPVGTEIKPNEDLYIYPYRTAIVFDDGKIVSSIPLKFSDETTFCYLLVEESGDVRRLKENSSFKMIVSDNQSSRGEYLSHLNENKIVEKHNTDLTLDNEHIKAIKCLTTEQDKPLKIEDFNRETGNRFNIIFPPIVDIK
jgi:hypothetical protein